MGWNPDRRAEMCSELDGFLTHKYGLTRDGLRYVLDPADVRGSDCPSATFRTSPTKNRPIQRVSHPPPMARWRESRDDCDLMGFCSIYVLHP